MTHANSPFVYYLNTFVFYLILNTMVSDFKYKLDIFLYAKENDLLIKSAFPALFASSKKVVFNKGEQLRFKYNDIPHLIFLHQGAILGTLYCNGNQLYKALKVQKSIFLNGPCTFSPFEIDEQEWIVANKAEITAISLNLLLEKAEEFEGARSRIEKHITDVILFDFQCYHKLLNISRLQDKVDYLVEHIPLCLEKTNKYLAEYLNVSQNGLANAIKQWGKINFEEE